jgi:soluble lytic murein transglycosylase-like protein
MVEVLGMTTQTIIAIIVAYSKIFGVDPDVAVAVAKTESNFNIEATGPVGEIGIFQIRPEFYGMLTPTELREPRTNIMMGIKKLAAYKSTCVHRDGLDYLTCYNAGPGGAQKIKYPGLFPYVLKVEAEVARLRADRFAARRKMAQK